MPQQDLSPAPTALPCLSKGPLSQVHSWAHVPAWPLPVPIPSEVPSAPWLPCPWEWHCLVALQEALALTANKTKGNVMRRHFPKEVHLKSWYTPLKVSYLEFHIASHKTLEQPDWTTIILLWKCPPNSFPVNFYPDCVFLLLSLHWHLFLFLFSGGEGWEASMAEEKCRMWEVYL